MIPSRFRHTVMPVLLALLVGVMSLPPLNIFRVDARGLGHEHAAPWRRSSLFTAPALIVATWLRRVRSRLTRLQSHTLFKPTLAAATLAIAAWLGPASVFASPVLMGALSEGRHAGEFLLGERPDGGSRDNITVLSGQNLKAGAICGRVTVGIGRVSIPTVVGTGNGTASLVFAGPEVELGSYVVTCTTAVAHGGVFSVTTPSGKTLPALTLTAGAGNTTAYTSRHLNFSITDGSTDFIATDAFTFVVSTTAPTVIGGTGTGTISALSLGPDARPGRYQVINREAITNGGRFEVIDPDGESLGENFLMTAGSGTATAFTSRQINFTLTDATDFIAGNYFDVAVFNQLSGGKAVAWDPTTFDGRHKAAGVLYDNTDATSADLAGVLVTRDATVIKGSLEWAAAITSSQKESAYLDLAARGIIAR